MSPLSVNQIESDLIMMCGNITDEDISSPNRILCINKSFWEIAGKFKFREAEANYAFNTVSGTKSYPVPGDLDGMLSLSVENPNSFKHDPVLPINKQDYETTYVNRDEARGYPNRYYREASNVVIFPTPDDAYSMLMKYLKTLADLIAGGSVSIPREWDEPILFGAIYRAWMILGDKENATWYRNQQVNMIESIVPTESKEEIDTRYASVYPVTSNDPSNPRRILWKGGR